MAEYAKTTSPDVKLATLIGACSSECQLPTKIFFAAPAFWLSKLPVIFEFCLRSHGHDEQWNFFLLQGGLQVTIEVVRHDRHEDRRSRDVVWAHWPHPYPNVLSGDEPDVPLYAIHGPVDSIKRSLLPGRWNTRRGR